MHQRLSRALAVAGVVTLAAGGALLAAAPAQALPASVVFSDQNCDIPFDGGLVDGVDFTVTNATTEPGAIDYEIRIALGTTVVESTVLQPGESQRHVIPLPEDVSTAVQIIDNSGALGVIAGDTLTINCDENSSPEATASIVADCLLPTGGIIPPSPGILFTLDNSAGTGPADYNFILDGESFESGVVAAGDTRQRSTSLTDEPGTAEVQSTDADGNTVTLSETDYDLDCNGPDGYSAEATAAVTDASCVLPTGGILVPTIPGVEFTLDNSEGTVGAAYEFVAGDVSVESGTVAAGENRVRSVSLVEDEVTLVQVISIDENDQPVVLAEREVVLDCVANVPTIDSPSDGDVLTEETVVISGTADGSDTVTVALAPADLVEGDVSAAAAPLEGPVTFTVPVQDDGTYSVTTQLANDDYVATAVAARGESEGGLVEASVSTPSEPVAFSVAVVADPGTGGGGDGGGDNGGGGTGGGDNGGTGTGGSGTGAAGSGGGALASTGSDAGLAVGFGALLALMGAGLVFGRRILRGARA